MKRLFTLISCCLVLTHFSGAQSWKNFQDSALIFASAKNNSGALDYYLRVHIILQKDSAVSETYYKNNTDIGDLYMAIGQYAKATPYYITARQVIEKVKGKESAEFASSCSNLGWIYRLTGQYQQAETLLIEAKDIRQRIFGKENADYATSCNRLAVLYADVGMYDDAAPLYKEAKDIRERVLGKEHLDYAMSCNNLAIYYMLTGRPYEAEPYALEAKQLREKLLGKEHALYAASCNNLAVLYLDLGLYNKAEPLYIEAREIRGRTLGREHPEYAASCDNLAILYMDRGQYEKAEKLYMEARAIREKVMGTRHPEYAKGCNNLGLLYRTLGQFERAEPLLLEACDILGSVLGKDHPEYAKCCNNLGALYMDMGNYAKAAPLYDQARGVWEKVLGKEHPEYAKSCNNLALIYRNSGEFSKAEALFLEASRIREKNPGKDHPDYAQSCDNLAVLYTDMGMPSRSLPLHETAKQIRERVFGKEHPDYIQSCINLANLYRNLGDNGQAGILFAEAFNNQQALTRKVFRFTTERDKQNYLSKINEFSSYFLSYSVFGSPDSTAGYAYDVSLANRNLILTSSRQVRNAIIKHADTALSRKYDEWISTREQLAGWYLKPLAERNETFRRVSEHALSLEKELVTASVAFKKQQAETNWMAIRESLGPGEAAIEFTTFRYYDGKRWSDSTFYAAVIVRYGNKVPRVVRLFESRELDAILNYRNTSPGQHILSNLYTTKGNGERSIYDLVWAPLEEWLAGIKTIYFSPAGQLHKIAFAALPVSNGVALRDRYQLVQLHSTGWIAGNKPSSLQASDRFVLYGGVQYDVDSLDMIQAASRYNNKDLAGRSLPADIYRDGIGSFHFLQGSEKEINNIAALAREMKYPIEKISGGTATEESFKDLSGKHSPAVLHVATHGYFFPDAKIYKQQQAVQGGIPYRVSDNPLIRSGLALAGANHAWKGRQVAGIEDGILTAYEVSNMDLPNTKLAVLSACETGLGDVQGSEGVYGLQRAFRMAGAEHLVMSLWKVPDLETSEFMQLFYQNLFSRQTIQQAFYNAQAVMKTRYNKDPYKWAAWVLIK